MSLQSVTAWSDAGVGMEPAARVRTLTAIADGERSGPLGHSASLPQLDIGRRGRGRRTRLPTPAVERIDLALPPVSLGRSRSLSALTGLANARQQRVQIELDRVVKRQHEGQQPAEPLTGASIAARAKTKVNAFDEMFEEIATIFEDAAAIRTPATTAAAAAPMAAPTAEEVEEAEARRKEEGRLRHAAELQRKMASCGRRVSRARLEVEKKIELLREDDEAWFDFDKYCTSIRVPPGSDIVLLGPGPKRTLS
jgi:hypothetical protein